MNTITIPKQLTKNNDLIIVSRKEYEALLELKKAKEFKLSTTQKKALFIAERNLKKRKTLSYHELVRKLDFAN